ncbi:MAG TPA: hypothetical protein PLH02_01200 [Bacillota bacterium]|nr:hypothetical protein [Bacillota bacterium]HPF41962.1 hypothetical protein [Bacillota bacterium]HPJ85565.1 hypothetical protein [Bacillota bacterium]HPQ61483.1 hypothetical protein [Bacillota bacterium]HRX92017.1 hypothetical protein [Candidatus Izemoplasmatales bacterium]
MLREIRKKIADILMMDDLAPFEDETKENEMVEVGEEYEYEEIFTDLFISVRNLDAFYGDKSIPKAALLLESFLMESLVLLKKDPDVVYVESGDDFLKSTSFTPESEGVMRAFENCVLINTMLDSYNEALKELDCDQIDAGIALAAYPKEEKTEPEEGGDEYTDYPEYGIDRFDTAERLSWNANTGELDILAVNDMAYAMLLDEDKLFFETHLSKASQNVEDITVYTGNIVADED